MFAFVFFFSEQHRPSSSSSSLDQEIKEIEAEAKEKINEFEKELIEEKKKIERKSESLVMLFIFFPKICFDVFTCFKFSFCLKKVFLYFTSFCFLFLELQGEDIDTASEFANLEKQFADKKAVSAGLAGFSIFVLSQRTTRS